MTHASQHSATGNDLELFKSATTNQQALKHSSVQAISEALRLVFVKVGLRAANLPNEAEKAVVINFIYNNYFNHTAAELVLAFDLAILGKLDCETKHYENFTCLYLGEIMTAYRKWAVNQAELVKRPLPKMTLNNSITTDAEMLQDIEDFENRKDVTIDSIPPYIYDYLLKFERLPTENAKKWDALSRAADYRKTELYSESLKLRTDDVNKYQEFLKMYAANEYKGDEINRVKLLAKKIMVMDYLEQINF